MPSPLASSLFAFGIVAAILGLTVTALVAAGLGLVLTLALFLSDGLGA